MILEKSSDDMFVSTGTSESALSCSLPNAEYVNVKISQIFRFVTKWQPHLSQTLLNANQMVTCEI